jgi:hypothetical protein
MPRAEDAVDRVGVPFRVSRRMVKPRGLCAGLQPGEIEPEGVGRVEEQLLRRLGQDHVRIGM